ncbi:quinone oxidoreductase family protein [Rhizorhabdus wittichii]|uniref:quinone oxidoreductase family protein n=1 Tax=Rhizorhabdus wittichii TaxID=160791 RepID=UPI00036DF05F|nr:zinc-binding dehydrogenase [Rhizorhabdus wittichii]
MKAIIVDQPGGADVLTLRDVPAPAFNDRQVLVEVAYCGCNWADTQIRAGTYPHRVGFPVILGFEVSGVVREVGDRVSRFSPGDRVCAIVDGGGYSEQIAIDEDRLIAVPDDVDLDVAAAFPIQALTAYHMLHTIFGVAPGDTVLCHAVGGGVGLYVTQLAVAAGARVLGTVGTPGKETLALQYGAERVVNTKAEDFVAAAHEFTQGRGIDLTIDSLGANTLDRSFSVMRNLGHVISIGEAEGEPFLNIRERILPKSLSFTRFHLLHVDLNGPAWTEGVAAVMQAVTSGQVQVPIVHRFPLREAADMHRLLEGRSVAGKLLLSARD